MSRDVLRDAGSERGPSSGLWVLVVGAGVAGLACATALDAAGHSVRVVERLPEAPRSGTAFNLPGNAVRALVGLGHGGVVSTGRPVMRREYRTADGRLLFAVDELDFWRDVGPSVSISHDSLHRGLARGRDVAYGVCVQEVRQTRRAGRNPGVTVTYDDGTEDIFDLVVGADGVRSEIRAQVVDSVLRPSLMTDTAWRLVVDNPGVECWTTWTGHGLVLLAMPLPDDELYIYAARTRGGPVGAESQWVRDSFSRFDGVPRPLLDAVARRAARSHRGAVEEVRAERWSSGRVVLVGDAAHATGPVWAEGAGMALEDALVLGQELGGSKTVEAGLQHWEIRRRARVEHVQTATDRMSRLARVPGIVQRIVLPTTGPRTFRATYEVLRAEP